MATNDELQHVWPPEGPEQGASLRVRWSWGAATQQGSTGARNDDYYAVARFERKMEMLATNLPAGSIPDRHGEAVYAAMIADGIGGLAASEIASRTAATTLIDLVIGTPDWIMRLDDDFRQRMERRLELRLQWVDGLLKQRAREAPGVHPMAAAMTVAASSGRDLIIGHVGSARAYHWHAGTLTCLTRDHTLVQSLAEVGVIGPDEAQFHPQRHVVTRALGLANGPVMVDLHHRRIADGDGFVLCTDGLSGVVAESAIAAVLRSVLDPSQAAETLVSHARKAGPPDDATAVVIRYEIAE